MAQTFLRLDRNDRNGLDQLAARENCSRSDVIRLALHKHVRLNLDDFPSSGTSYVDANLDEARRTLGRVISKLRRESTAVDSSDVSARLGLVERLLTDAMAVAAVTKVGEGTKLGDVPLSPLTNALEQVRDGLQSLRTQVWRAGLAARGDADLPE